MIGVKIDLVKINYATLKAISVPLKKSNVTDYQTFHSYIHSLVGTTVQAIEVTIQARTIRRWCDKLGAIGLVENIKGAKGCRNRILLIKANINKRGPLKITSSSSCKIGDVKRVLFQAYRDFLRKNDWFIEMDGIHLTVGRLKIKQEVQSKNGRLYLTPFCQLPKDKREKIRINGQDTIEIDFKSLHPTLLYRLSNILMPEFDLYSVKGVSRGLCKIAFLTLLNADSERVAKLSVHQSELKWMLWHETLGDKAEKNRICRQVIDHAIEELKRIHQPISSFLGSGISRTLMYIDSILCLRVLRRIQIELKILALPIHDSFIVQKDKAQEVELIMKQELDDICSDEKFQEMIKKAI